MRQRTGCTTPYVRVRCAPRDWKGGSAERGNATLLRARARARETFVGGR
jgi:hypothetical protein